MTSKIVDTVKSTVAGVVSKAGMVGAHGKDVLHTGAETLHAARAVVAEGGRQAGEVLSHTKDELKRTLKEGASRVGDKLSRLATPTRLEQADARKAEIKAKKRRKREESAAEAASPSA